MKGLNVIFPDSSLQEEIIEQVMQHLHNSITNLTALPPSRACLCYQKKVVFGSCFPAILNMTMLEVRLDH